MVGSFETVPVAFVAVIKYLTRSKLQERRVYSGSYVEGAVHHGVAGSNEGKTLKQLVTSSLQSKSRG